MLRSAQAAAPWGDVGSGGAEPDAPEPLDFDGIYEQWFEEVTRWVRALGGPAADRDDLVQEVFLIVYRRLPEFDGQNTAGWLYQITRRRVRDFRRLLWVKHLFSRSVPITDRLLSLSECPVQSLEAKEKTRQLERLLRDLNEDQRAAFVLFELEGYSGDDIARLQGVPINTVWARIHKARKKLQEQLAKLDGTAPRRTPQ